MKRIVITVTVNCTLILCLWSSNLRAHSGHQTRNSEQSSFLGSEPADTWRALLVQQTLQQLDKPINNVHVYKLSPEAETLLRVNGYSTSDGIWLLHDEQMDESLAYYITVHEAVHYAYHHPKKLSLFHYILEHATIGINSAILTGTAYVARSIKNSMASIIATAITASILTTKWCYFMGKKFKEAYGNTLEKEADQIAAYLIEKQGKTHILTEILEKDAKRQITLPLINHDLYQYKQKLYQKQQLSSQWPSCNHIQNIQEYIEQKIAESN